MIHDIGFPEEIAESYSGDPPFADRLANLSTLNVNRRPK
jgi:hypothetical protein